MKLIKGQRLFWYNASNAGQALLDSLLLTFHLSFLLPPDELVESGSMVRFIPDTIFGFIPALATIMVIGRIVDAVADPLVASMSDRSESRFGRRRFFMMLSALPLALATMMVFFPPLQLTSHINTLYLALAFSLFFLFYTMYVAPYIALIPEIATDDKNRIEITTAQGFFALAGGAAAMIGGPVLIEAFSAESSVSAYQLMVTILSALGFVLMLGAIFAVDEKKFSTAVPSSIPLMKSIKLTLSNRYFLIFLGGNMALWFVFNVLRSSAIHIGLTLMGQTVKGASLNFTILFALAGVSFLVVMKLAERFGKRIIMISGLLSFALLSAMLALTNVLPIDPQLYGAILFGLCGYPTAVLLIIPNVYIAELCDYDFTVTKEHREGMYFGAHGFFLKLNLGLSSGITSWFFITFGKEISNPLGVRLSLIFAALIAFAGIALFSRYPKQLIKTVKTR